MYIIKSKLKLNILWRARPIPTLCLKFAYVCSLSYLNASIDSNIGRLFIVRGCVVAVDVTSREVSQRLPGRRHVRLLLSRAGRDSEL